MFAALTTRLWFLQVLDVGIGRSAGSIDSRLDSSKRTRPADASTTISDRRWSATGSHSRSGSPRTSSAATTRKGSCCVSPTSSGSPSRRSGRASTTRTTTTTSRSPSRTTLRRTSASTSPSTRRVPRRRGGAGRRPRLPATARWRPTSWAGSGRSTRRRSRTKQFKNYGPNDLVGQDGAGAAYERYLRGRKGQQKYLVDSNQQIDPARSASSPPFPATTWSSHSTSTRSASPSRRSSDGIANTRAIFDDIAGSARRT